MSKPVRIKIAEPCHERWANMTPTEKGAFCAACQKQVVDFTRKTQNEIYDLVTASDKPMCGRFLSTQIDTPIVKTTIHKSLFNWRAIAASLGALLAGKEGYAGGDNNHMPLNECTKTAGMAVYTTSATAAQQHSTLQQDTAITITGKVVDAKTCEPLYGVAVILRSTLPQGAQTDIDGNFTLKADVAQLEEGNFRLEIIYVGYQETTVYLHKQQDGHKLPAQAILTELGEIKLAEADYAIMGAYVITTTTYREEEPELLLDDDTDLFNKTTDAFDNDWVKNKFGGVE